MREIRFRFWDAKEGKWLGKDSSYWKELTFEDCRNKLIASMRQGNIVAEQYTGLKDKNGKEIYEGDILQDSKGECCRVEWNEKEAHFGLYTNRQFELTDFVWMRGEDVEVIGNIHDYPELLEGEK